MRHPLRQFYKRRKQYAIGTHSLSASLFHSFFGCQVFQFSAVGGNQILLQRACLKLYHDIVIVGADQSASPFKMRDLHDFRIGQVQRGLDTHGLVIFQIQDNLGLGVVDDAFSKPSFVQIEEIVEIL